MDAVASVIDKIKGISQDFLDGLPLPRRYVNSTRRNPVEILKRLQREAFSDLMKLRDRQDKVERMLSFYKTSKGNPFQGSGTQVRGAVDALGAVLMMGNFDQQHYDAVGRAGIEPGISSRFTFETTIRENDALVAELVASQKGTRYPSDLSGASLSLAKVLYVANISDWFSATAILIGAQVKDLGITTYSYNQRRGLTDLLSAGPPLLNKQIGTAFGITARKSNVVASVGQSVSRLETGPCDDGIRHGFSTFGQIVCKLPTGMELSILGHRQIAKTASCVKFGALTLPASFLRRDSSETFVEESAPPGGTSTCDFSSDSIALKLESLIDLDTRIAGWIEVKTSDPKNLQWAVNLFDDSEDENGWGLNFGGVIEGRSRCSRLQAESYVKLNLGKKFCLKPGIVYAVDGDARILSLMVGSNWYF